MQFIANKSWINSLDIEIVTTPNISLKTIDAVCEAINETIDFIGLKHELVNCVYDQHLKELIALTSPNNSPLIVREIMPYFRPDETKFKTINNQYYYNNKGIKVIVTKNDGIYKESRPSAKAEAQVYAGLVYLPIPSKRESEFLFTKNLAKHEIGHVLGLKVAHHNNLSNNSGIMQPYQVLGYDNCDDCVMNDSLEFIKGYNFERTFCQKFKDSSRIIWSELEKQKGINYLL